MLAIGNLYGGAGVSRKRWIWTGVVGAIALLIGLIAWSLSDELAYARIATGYAAKQTCSCVHVSGRTLASCIAEFPPEAAQIKVAQDGDSVRASVLFGAISATARFEPDFGCTPAD
jgi:hypothetical protein